MTQGLDSQLYPIPKAAEETAQPLIQEIFPLPPNFKGSDLPLAGGGLTPLQQDSLLQVPMDFDNKLTGSGRKFSEDSMRPMTVADLDRENAQNAAKHLRNLIPDNQAGMTKGDIEEKLKDRSLSHDETRALQWMHEKYGELATNWHHDVDGWFGIDRAIGWTNYRPMYSHISPRSFKENAAQYLKPKV